jgi:hypothetical protein
MLKVIVFTAGRRQSVEFYVLCAEGDRRLCRETLVGLRS